jgi:hypothetical protein
MNLFRAAIVLPSGRVLLYLQHGLTTGTCRAC